MAKPRVHEIAKELGLTSKEVLAHLEKIGETVKSHASTVEEPVAARLTGLRVDIKSESQVRKEAEEASAAVEAPAEDSAPTPAES